VTTIYGWDMSHYDDPGIGSAVSEGFAFITHKAGGDSDDAELGPWWNGVKNIPASRVLLGAYFVLYPGNPTGKADAFISRLDSQCPGWRSRPFILQVDCETWGGRASTKPGRADIKAFCDRLRSRMPKLRPIVYAPKWCYNDELTGLGYPLWASSYVSGSGYASALYPGDTSSRWGSYSGQAPAILQFTSSATIAGQTTCDANAYRGTLAQLSALVAPGWIPAPPAPPAPVPPKPPAPTPTPIPAGADMNLTDKINDAAHPPREVGDLFRDLAKLRGFLIGDPEDTANAAMGDEAPIVRMARLPEQVAALRDVVGAVFGAADRDDASIAATLSGMLGPERAVHVGSLMAASAPAAARLPMRAEDVPDDEADRASREQVQRRIAGPYQAGE
jgi:hypothetical protein